MFVPEFLLSLRRIGADTQDGNTGLFKYLEFIPESLAFNRSTGGTGLWEKPDYQFFPAEIT